jgi:hypothetical protein
LNRGLVICLYASLAVGLAAAVWALAEGWHPLLALAAYSLTGSLSLFAFVFVAAFRRSRARDVSADLGPLHAPQST